MTVNPIYTTKQVAESKPASIIVTSITKVMIRMTEHQEYKLVNFKMNPITKKMFHTICKENHLGMTSVLNSMIQTFIDTHQKDHHIRFGDIK